MAVNDLQKETFAKLLNQIRTQVSMLRSENKDLKRENLKLKNKIEEIQNDKTDVFSSISESERIAMRHQISNLIKQIEKHTGE